MSALASSPHLVTQALLAGPQTAAPPAYNGVGWLVALNLGVMTACMWVGAMAALACAGGLWRHRQDSLNHPANLLRFIGLLAMLCFTMRCGGEALQLWSWNPKDFTTAAWVRTVKHYVDPVAVTLGLAAIAVATLSWHALIEHVSRKPLPPNLWARLPMLKRPAIVVFLAFAASIGVVATR